MLRGFIKLALAVVAAVWLPRGVWGALSGRFNLRLFAVGYRLVPGRQR